LVGGTPTGTEDSEINLKTMYQEMNKQEIFQTANIDLTLKNAKHIKKNARENTEKRKTRKQNKKCSRK
jgi:hypothetical protein